MYTLHHCLQVGEIFEIFVPSTTAYSLGMTVRTSLGRSAASGRSLLHLVHPQDQESTCHRNWLGPMTGTPQTLIPAFFLMYMYMYMNMHVRVITDNVEKTVFPPRICIG